MWGAAEVGHDDKQGVEAVTEYASCFVAFLSAGSQPQDTCHTDVKAADGSTRDKHLKEIVCRDLSRYCRVCSNFIFSSLREKKQFKSMLICCPSDLKSQKGQKVNSVDQCVFSSAYCSVRELYE